MRAFTQRHPQNRWLIVAPPSKARGQISVLSDNPFNLCHPHYLRLQSEGSDGFGVTNEGFRGMGVKAGEAYNLSLRIRGQSGTLVLIWVDNLSVARTPNYYVQQMFCHHRGDWTLPIEISPKDQANPICASATSDDTEILIKIVNPGDGQAVEILLAGAGKVEDMATVLTAADLEQQNTLVQPNQVLPKESVFTVTANPFVLSVKPHTFTVLRVQTKPHELA